MKKSKELQALLDGIEKKVEEHKRSGFGIPRSTYHEMVADHGPRAEKVKSDMAAMKEMANGELDD